MVSTIVAPAGFHTRPLYYPQPTPIHTRPLYYPQPTPIHIRPLYYPQPTPIHTRVMDTKSWKMLQTNVEYLDLEAPQHWEYSAHFHKFCQYSKFHRAPENCRTYDGDVLSVSEVSTKYVSAFTGDPITALSDAGSTKSSSSSQDSDGPEAKESVLDETKPSLKPEVTRVISNYHTLTVQYMNPASIASVTKMTDVAVGSERGFLQNEDVLPPPLPRKMAMKRAKTTSSKRPLLSPQIDRRKMSLQTAIATRESEVTQSKEDSVTANNCLQAFTIFPSPDLEEQPTSQRTMMLEFSLHAPSATPNFVCDEEGLQELKDKDMPFRTVKAPSSVSSDSGTSRYSPSLLFSPSFSPCCSPDYPTVDAITSSEPFNNRLHPSTITDLTAENLNVVVASVQNVSLASNDTLVRLLPNTSSSSDFNSYDFSAVSSSGIHRPSAQPVGTVGSFIKCVSPPPYKKSTPVPAPSNTGKDFVLSVPPVRPPRHIYRTSSNASAPKSLPRIQLTQPYKGASHGSNPPPRADESICLPPLPNTTEATKPSSRLNGLVHSSLSPDGPPTSKHRLPGTLNVLSSKFFFQRSKTFHFSTGFFSRQKSQRVEAPNPSSTSSSVLHNSSGLVVKNCIVLHDSSLLVPKYPTTNSLAVHEPIARGTRKNQIQRSFDSSYGKSKSFPQERVKNGTFGSDCEHRSHPIVTRKSVKRSSDGVNRRIVVIGAQLYEGGDGSDEPEFSYVPESGQQLTKQAGGAGGQSPATPAAISPLQLKESIELLQDGLASGSLVGKFEILCRRKPGLLMDVARLPRNEPRNRYRDISPYDTTRVILLNTDASTPSTLTAGASTLNDYINASHVVMEIPGSNITNRYIACQGPLNSTCGQFWQMVWEQQSTLLVMLTTCIEQGRSKCHQYWPEVNNIADYGLVTVSCDQQKLKPGYAVRELTVTHKKSGERRQLEHLQYLSWPDHGVPEHSTDFLAFVKQVRDIRAAGACDHPTIVHCSAGIGRTGVLILMETAQCLIEAQQPVYPVDLVQTMRDQRAMMIQTSGQFRFVCEAICRVYNEKLVEPLSIYSHR